MAAWARRVRYHDDDDDDNAELIKLINCLTISCYGGGEDDDDDDTGVRGLTVISRVSLILRSSTRAGFTVRASGVRIHAGRFSNWDTENFSERKTARDATRRVVKLCSERRVFVGE